MRGGCAESKQRTERELGSDSNGDTAPQLLHPYFGEEALEAGAGIMTGRVSIVSYARVCTVALANATRMFSREASTTFPSSVNTRGVPWLGTLWHCSWV